MMIQNPWQFTDIPSLHPETQLYTSRRRLGEAPTEYKYTIQALVNYLASAFGFVQKYGASAYASDAAAGAQSVPIGGAYELSASNIYGLPAGLLKIRKT